MSNNKKYKIQVRQYPPGQSSHGIFCLAETVNRSIHAEQIGNFNPFFCTYKGKSRLIKSDDGDVSDPFRREESYADTFFITIPLDSPTKNAMC